MLIQDIEKLKKTEAGNTVRKRINEFKELGKKSEKEIFKELCFCILTANFSAERSILIQNKIGDGFLTFSESRLAEKLSELGYRFPNARAKYVVEARRYANNLKKIIKSFDDEFELREWLTDNIKGLGYKESSHFLRNIGFKNSAIIDFHIVDILVRNKLIKKPKNKSLSRKKYIEIEDILKEIAKKVSLSLAELDLYMWFLETGKVLK